MRCLATKTLEHFSPGSTKDVVNPMNLIQLVFAREEWLFGDQLEQYAAKTPNIHFLVVIAISHQTLRSPVPASGDIVSIGSR